MGGDQHWVRWHEDYEDPDSSLSRRLALVQRRLRDALDVAPAGPIRVISMCAGQGRDVIEVLEHHPRASDVRARLVELDPELVTFAARSAEEAGLRNVEVVEGDASLTSAYAGAVPAQILLVCGVFGNISPAHIHETVLELPRLAVPGATVIWTRHRRDPDLTPAIREWFGEAGFEEVAFDTIEGSAVGVGTHRLVAPPLPFRVRRMFTFAGDGYDARF